MLAGSPSGSSQNAVSIGDGEDVPLYVKSIPSTIVSFVVVIHVFRFSADPLGLVRSNAAADG